MKIAKALKTYLEGDMHVPGKKCSLDELKFLLGSKVDNYPGESRDAMTAELRGYGFEIEDSA